MSVDLGFRLNLAVYEPERRDREIKIFAVPIGLAQRELLSSSSLVDLDYVDSVCL